MPKIKQCDSCQFYSNNPHLVCAVHPQGVDTHICIDYRLNPDYIFIEQWCPEGYVYYDDELIKLPEDKPDKERQLWLLNNHPAFTVTVRENNQKVKVRMACIDAPESAQEGGQASTNRLKQLLPIGIKVSLNKVDTDRYGRTVAIVSKDNLNINLTMVQEGQAVVYRKYLSNCPDSQRYIDAEDKAKQKGIGFWGIKNPVMPWDWRQGKRATTSITKPSNSNSSNLPACVNSDCDCKDFSTQAQAQKVLDSFPGDPHRLDQDKDGIACESLP